MWMLPSMPRAIDGNRPALGIFLVVGSMGIFTIIGSHFQPFQCNRAFERALGSYQISHGKPRSSSTICANWLSSVVVQHTPSFGWVWMSIADANDAPFS